MWSDKKKKVTFMQIHWVVQKAELELKQLAVWQENDGKHKRFNKNIHKNNLKNHEMHKKRTGKEDLERKRKNLWAIYHIKQEKEWF